MVCFSYILQEVLKGEVGSVAKISITPAITGLSILHLTKQQVTVYTIADLLLYFKGLFKSSNSLARVVAPRGLYVSLY